MSSSSIPPSEDFGRRQMSFPGSAEASHQESEGLSVRQVRLKVLYTFDNENRTNCLARYPHVLTIRTAYLDETTQIGVIELKKCIQAIVTASPEIVAKLGQDYTVYAYDYSEYETPLVGQGMLSWVLASASSTPAAPAHQSRTMVTGRVCKNILGLFQQGNLETLEVKLRLVPVPTCLQSEYIDSMRKYRDLSRIMPEGFDPQAWTDFLKSNPGLLSSVPPSRSESPALGSGQKEVGIEHVQRLMGERYPPRPQSSREQSFHQRRESSASMVGGQESFSTTSPASVMQLQNGPPVQQIGWDRSVSRASNQSSQAMDYNERQRSASRASNQGISESDSLKRSSMDLGYVSNDEALEQGPTRKRAKMMKADWPAKNSFGKQADSLRVAASTAASVRVFQPTAIRPGNLHANSLEETPRVPTPVPRAGSQMLRPLLPAPRSNLGQDAFTINGLDYRSPYVLPLDVVDTAKLLDSAMTSPEKGASHGVVVTPAPPGSSPPTLERITPAPSSPMLPVLPRNDDSGFMSASLEELFGDKDDEEDQSPDKMDLEMVSQYNARSDIHSLAIPETVQTSLPATKAMKPKAPSRSGSSRPRNPVAGGRSRPLSRTTSSGSALPIIAPFSDPVQPPFRVLHRAQTWSEKQPGSDISIGSEGLEAPLPKPRSGWNKEKRKQAIKSKLETAILAGEMPQFCENCGAIETPTFRKAFSKIQNGSLDEYKDATKDDGIVAYQVLETNTDGSCKAFKVYKKSLLDTDQDFTPIFLCNPCGLWLGNHKQLRPASCWESNKPKGGNGGKKGGPKKKKPQKGATTHDQTASQRGGSMAMDSDTSSPPDGPTDDTPTDNDHVDEPELPTLPRQRAMSAHSLSGGRNNSDPIVNAAAISALQRAVQSSPGNHQGTKDIPILLDDPTPAPARRTLFPSPKSKASVGFRLEDVNAKHSSEIASGVMPNDEADKENRPPLDDLFDDLFDDLPPHHTRQTTPPPNFDPSPLMLDPFKTPSKATPKRSFSANDFFSSAAKAFLHPPRTPSMTPSKGSNPKSSQPLGEMTPFTRHLNTLLSDQIGPDHNGSPRSKFLGDFSNFSPLGESQTTHDGPYDANPHTPSRYLNRAGTQTMRNDFDFDPFGTNAPVPSSPPQGWFGVYEDHVEGGWSELGLGSSPFKDTSDDGQENRVEGKEVEEVADRVEEVELVVVKEEIMTSTVKV